MTVTINGKPPANPMGSCFDSAAHALVQMGDTQGVIDIRVCHGIGISNVPGEPAEAISHAWIEVLTLRWGRIAIDAVWMLSQPAELYRSNLQVSLVKEYSRELFMKKWHETGYPGPWEDCLQALTKEGKR